MKELLPNQMHRIAPLFEGWDQTILWSCLQGYMGRAWADNLERPVSARVLVGDFCFLAGRPNRELAEALPPESQHFLLLIPREREWHSLIERVHTGRCTQILRYPFAKDTSGMDRERLQYYAGRIGTGYTIQAFDRSLYHQAKQEAWSSDLCSQFPRWEDYRKHGIGFGALWEGRLVSGASSYTVYDGGIEIEIDTREDHRRKGLAAACAARLILACLERGVMPSWDAHHLASAALARKLGYRPQPPYIAYERKNTPSSVPLTQDESHSW